MTTSFDPGTCCENSGTVTFYGGKTDTIKTKGRRSKSECPYRLPCGKLPCEDGECPGKKKDPTYVSYIPYYPWWYYYPYYRHDYWYVNTQGTSCTYD